MVPANRRGFHFDNCKRNELLESKGSITAKFTKTGTTIVGLIYKDGVILGADTRATEGPIVADKNCEKLHRLTENMYCAGAGTAADTEYTTNMIASKLELHRLNTNRQPRVVTAASMLSQHLFQYQGHIGANLILGGYDINGPQLISVMPHGSTDKLPYMTLGSGMLAAMAVFETKWKPNMERDDAIALVTEAVSAGIFNDLGSGSNVDVVVITKDRTDYLRNHSKPNQRVPKQTSYKYPPGSVSVIRKEVRYHSNANQSPAAVVPEVVMSES
ncbi:proteasome core particle subunit beta 2 [Mycoemilia scoparia]|uniref:Proteasome subunit beta n=1 Tax=Mycoemilia scoparia TaxID=417184 RepID=A0A9W8A2Y7_9FUNG|nr:proteasome core particle subunit beta 2 [Mycoemilia scoparia]